MINLIILILFRKTDRLFTFSDDRLIWLNLEESVVGRDFCRKRSRGAVIARPVQTDLLLVDELHVMDRHGAAVLE